MGAGLSFITRPLGCIAWASSRLTDYSVDCLPIMALSPGIVPKRRCSPPPPQSAPRPNRRCPAMTMPNPRDPSHPLSMSSASIAFAAALAPFAFPALPWPAPSFPCCPSARPCPPAGCHRLWFSHPAIVGLGLLRFRRCGWRLAATVSGDRMHQRCSAGSSAPLPRRRLQDRRRRHRDGPGGHAGGGARGGVGRGR